MDSFASFPQLPAQSLPLSCPGGLWLPWRASQCNPPCRLFLNILKIPFENVFTFFPGRVFSGLLWKWQKNGKPAGYWGQCDKQHSKLCCFFKSLGKCTALTCFYMYFKTLIFQWKYSQWDFGASNLWKMSIDCVAFYIYNQQFTAKWRFQWNGIHDDWHQPWCSFVLPQSGT